MSGSGWGPRPTGPDRAQVEGFFVPEMISGVRMCSGRTPIPIRRAGRRRRAGNQFRSFTAAGGFGREVLASTGPMMRCDYLAALARDGTLRIDRWLKTYGGAEDDE